MGAGAPFVLVSHNVVECMDAALPASLSPAVHEVLRETLGFDGIVITDDLAMDAVKQYANGEAAVLAVLAGNDMLITSDYQNDIPAVLAAVADGASRRARSTRTCFASCAISRRRGGSNRIFWNFGTKRRGFASKMQRSCFLEEAGRKQKGAKEMKKSLRNSILLLLTAMLLTVSALADSGRRPS